MLLSQRGGPDQERHFLSSQVFTLYPCRAYNFEARNIKLVVFSIKNDKPGVFLRHLV